ncbi:aldehyde dehydrogenase family protein [Pseudonocardia kongjuensis]|uniref:Aldehyde dehydrogenase family protein n=1 Tax=Pseudonocardia kongjuensis TaxID=102227 RepID=A0ABN1Y171_9PSEU
MTSTRDGAGTLAGVQPSLRAWLEVSRPMLIGGVPVGDAPPLAVEDPSTGLRIAEVAIAGAEHVDRAVSSARAAFEADDWRWLAASDRGRLIRAAAAVVDRHSDELAQLDAIDAGIPIGLSRELIAAGVGSLEYAAGTAARISGDALAPSGLPGDRFGARVLREPLGVVAMILPWNSPAAMLLDKIGNVLATGNTAVVKPAEQTPLGALRVAELFAGAGLPPGVLNVVPGLGSVAGAALVEHPGVDAISFTGSTVTGKRIAAAAAANLTPVSLELGGKSPALVFPDADLDAAVETVAGNAFLLSGQFCTAPSRVFVHRQVFDEVLAGLCAVAGALVVGPPLDPSTTTGPLISGAQRERVLGLVGSGLLAGARAACGGDAVDGPGHYVAPTVLTGTTREMAVEREEVFGPVLSVTPFDGIDEAVRLANDTPYGLAAGVFTGGLATAERMTRDLQAGNVWINCYNAFDPALPFGGYKQSGRARESGTAAIDRYTQTKTVVTAT